jgi:hypothetical protein
MTTPAQPEQEKTWLEKLEEFLTDEFHYGVHRTITETVWGSEIMVGTWTDQLKFFASLKVQHEYVIANRNKPEHIRGHLQSLNFSGRDLSGGEEKKWLADQLPKNRQNILLLHSLRLILENSDQDKVNLPLILPIIKREIHQCLRLVFSHLANGQHSKCLESFVDYITRYEWLPMTDYHQHLGNTLIGWLEQQGVKRVDIDDFNKLGKFNRTLTKFMHYHPQIDGPVEFDYGHLFSDWQKYAFVGSMVYELDRFVCLINLETLSHSREARHEESFQTSELPLLTEKRTKGGTRYQNLLALHYILQHLSANSPNRKKAKFTSFVTGFSENTLRQQWSNVYSKRNGNSAEWEADMKLVRGYFEDLGCVDIVRTIDAELQD